RLPMWKGLAGLWLYDLLAGRDNLRGSRRLRVAQLRREFPGLNGRGLVGGAEYFDAQMDDARMCLEVVTTACHHGAAAGYSVDTVGGEPGAVRVRYRFGGGRGLTRAQQVLNATGPWVDAVERRAGGTGPPRLQPTKGVHLVAPDRGLTTAFLLLHPRDG